MGLQVFDGGQGSRCDNSVLNNIANYMLYRPLTDRVKVLKFFKKSSLVTLDAFAVLK